MKTPSILFLTIAVLIFITSCTPNNTPTSSAVYIQEEQQEQQEQQNHQGPFLVTKVIDGDTIEINTTAKIRLSGINTPETGECYYQEAKDFLSQLIMAKEIYLEKDISNKDKYGRLLRYVYINNNLVNGILVEQGYAKVYDYYQNDTSKYYQLKRIEDSAKTSQLGLWACPEKPCLYIGSKNSKKYYQPGCKYAKRIKQENQLCFTSEEEVKSMIKGNC